jgi:paraquat-inducible protein B
MRANPKAIGAFVLGALALAILAVILLGSGQLFRTTRQYVLFFRGDVNGLRIGAPVKFKGVEIGSVTQILVNLRLSPTNPLVRLSADVRIPVIIDLDESKLVSRGASSAILSDPQIMKELIGVGLRAQLAMESFVTGLLYIDLDIHPGSPANFALAPGAKYQEIPTLPTAMEQVQSAASRVLASLDKVDWSGILASASQTFAAIKGIVTSPELKDAIVNLNRAAESLARTSASFEKLTNHMNEEIGPLGGSLRASSKTADLTLKQIQVTVANLQTTLGPDSPLMYQSGKTLQDVSAASRALRELAEYLQRNPSALVRGRDYTQQPR